MSSIESNKQNNSINHFHTTIKVIHNENTKEDWDSNKVRQDIKLAFFRANQSLADDQEDKIIANLQTSIIENYRGTITTSKIREKLSGILREIDPTVSKAYEDLSLAKAKFPSMMENVIEKDAFLRNHQVHDNANADTSIVSSKRMIVYKKLSWEIYKNFFLTDEERKAHEEGYIYVHDRGERRDTMNCCLFDMGKVAQGGFDLENMHYNEPEDVRRALELVGDIMFSAAGNQYGGFSVPQIDTILEPYCEKSYKKYIEEFKDIVSSTGGKLNQNDADKYAYEKVRKDLEAGFRSIEYKVNTIVSARGDFIYPTMSFGLDGRRFGKLVTESLLKVRAGGEGSDKLKIPAIFPKLVFLYDEDKHGEGKPMNDIYIDALKCNSAAQYPDYLNLRSTGDEALGVPYGSPAYMYRHFGNGVYRWYLDKDGKVQEDPNWVDCVISPMGCRNYLAPYFYNKKTGKGSIYEVKGDPDFKPVYTGRWNGGPISLNLPMIYMKAKTEQKNFYEVLDYYLALIRDIHIKTKKYLSNMRASMNPLAFTQGGFFEGNLKPNNKLGGLLDYVTFSFGFVGLNELQELYNGKYISSDHQFAYEVEKHISDYCNKYKKIDNIEYALYATPAESLAYTQRNQFVKKYGIVNVGKDGDPVGSHEYWTNSFHDPVWVDIPLAHFDKKFKDEKKGFDMATGGHIVYYRIPTGQNLQLIKKIVLTALKYNFYYGVNIAKSFCKNCSYKWDDDKLAECPICHSKEIVSISRICGYLGYTRLPGMGESSTRVSKGKLAEVMERKVM